jgi:YfiH family protein
VVDYRATPTYRVKGWVSGVSAYIPTCFDPYPWITAFFSTRVGGTSPRPYDDLNMGLHVGDQPVNVIRNRLLFFGSLNIPLKRVVFAKQVHKPSVTVVDETHAGAGAWTQASALADTDAMITMTPSICLAVLLADCVPVLILDPIREVIAVAHAGWRGTTSGVVAETVRTMGDVYASQPSDLVAAIGPCISPMYYEVGEEVVAAARDRFGKKAHEVIRASQAATFFDLWTANVIELASCGVSKENISIVDVPTEAEASQLFSERRIGRPCGRFAAGLMMSEKR